MSELQPPAPLSESEVLSTRLWAENNLASKGSLDERIHSFYTNILALCDQALRSEIAPTRDAVLEEAALLADHEADRQSLFASEAEAKGDNSLSLTHGMIAYTLMHLAQRIRALKTAAGPAHSTEDDYQHFLSYSGLVHSEVLRYAYFHGAGADAPRLSNAGSPAPAAPDERAALNKDTERLDWLQQKGVKSGLGWIARESVTGRGYRLHQATADGPTWSSPRTAIDAAMKRESDKRG